MVEAFFWGALGASALLIGALAAYLATPSPKFIAVVMALGTGLLLGSVSFELIDEALKTTDVALVGAYTLVGAAAFTVGDWWLERRGGGDRKDSGGAQAAGSPLAIVLGSVLDGIPESFVLGLTVLQGQVSVALLRRPAQQPARRNVIIQRSSPRRMAPGAGGADVAVVIAVSAASAAIGYAVLDPTHGRTGAFAQAFAAGALLTMVADTLLPEAFRVEGLYTGSLVAIGFAISIILSAV